MGSVHHWEMEVTQSPLVSEKEEGTSPQEEEFTLGSQLHAGWPCTKTDPWLQPGNSHVGFHNSTGYHFMVIPDSQMLLEWLCLVRMHRGPFPLSMDDASSDRFKVVEPPFPRTLDLICLGITPVWHRESHHFISFQSFNPNTSAIRTTLHKSMIPEISSPHLPVTSNTHIFHRAVS